MHSLKRNRLCLWKCIIILDTIIPIGFELKDGVPWKLTASEYPFQVNQIYWIFSFRWDIRTIVRYMQKYYIIEANLDYIASSMLTLLPSETAKKK